MPTKPKREHPREGPYLAFSSILLCITCMNPGLDLAGDLQGQTGFWQISYSKDYEISGKLT